MGQAGGRRSSNTTTRCCGYWTTTSNSRGTSGRRCCRGTIIAAYYWVGLVISSSSISVGSRVVQALDLFGLGGGRGQRRNISSAKSKPTPLQLELLEKASQVRTKFGGPKSCPFDYCGGATEDALGSILYFDSSYSTDKSNNNNPKKENDVTGKSKRGFCNWLIPHRLMVGQYPGQTPERGGPTGDEVQLHLRRMVGSARIRLFCSLQTEIPSQLDYAKWDDNNGMIFLDSYYRKRFPYPFTHYEPIVQDTIRKDDENQNESIQFLHCPIEDLNVPESQQPLQELLLQLLDFLLLQEEEDNTTTSNAAMYLHCWGGRGRAGLVSGCLLSLIYPHLTPQNILQWIQIGYASRLGHENMPKALAISPQTDTQRAFVTNFVLEYQGYL